eukprot:COSAG03_NODE_11463_length_591_cov_0.902439_1_plen_144_part_00
MQDDRDGHGCGTVGVLIGAHGEEMFSSSMRIGFPRVGPSLAQNEWFPQVAQDELKELDALERQLEHEQQMIRAMAAPHPMGLSEKQGGAQPPMGDSGGDTPEEEEDEDDIDEADDASLEGSMDFDAGSNDTLDLDGDELLAGP